MSSPCCAAVSPVTKQGAAGYTLCVRGTAGVLGVGKSGCCYGEGVASEARLDRDYVARKGSQDWDSVVPCPCGQQPPSLLLHRLPEDVTSLISTTQMPSVAGQPHPAPTTASTLSPSTPLQPVWGGGVLMGLTSLHSCLGARQPLCSLLAPLPSPLHCRSPKCCAPSSHLPTARLPGGQPSGAETCESSCRRAHLGSGRPALWPGDYPRWRDSSAHSQTDERQCRRTRSLWPGPPCLWGLSHLRSLSLQQPKGTQRHGGPPAPATVVITTGI